MTKRHAKPTTAQLVERTYRQMLQFKLTLRNQMALMRLDIATERHRDREHMKTLADHCARLLKEKETLQKQIEKMREPFKIVPGEPVYNVEITPVEVKMGTYTYTGVLGGACALAHLHRSGIRCGVCGETPDGFSEQGRKL